MRGSGIATTRPEPTSAHPAARGAAVLWHAPRVPGPIRRIVAAVGLTMFIDAALYLAIVPLLPYYSDRFELSKLGAAVILASYPIAVPVTSIAAGALAPRIGGRTIAIAGAILMTAATIAFAFAPNEYILALARFVQGAASGITWVGSMAWLTVNTPTEIRGRATGIVMGMLSLGAIAGPGVGTLADLTSTELAFLLVAALSGLSVILTLIAPAGIQVASETGLVKAVGRALGNPLVIAALVLTLIDPMTLGAIDLLAPLALDDRGVETWQIGAALTAGAALGAIAGPIIGRMADRFGAIELAVTLGVLLALAPTVFAFDPPTEIVLAGLVLLGPVFAGVATVMYPLASQGADEVGVAHGIVNSLISVGWATAFTLSPLVAGLVADQWGDQVAYAGAALLCVPLLGVLVVCRRRIRRPAAQGAVG